MRRDRVAEIHFYEWRIGAWLASETRDRLDATGRGIYRELLDSCYAQSDFPDEEEWICRRCACTPEQYQKVWKVISRHFPKSGRDGYRHNILANIVRKEYFSYVQVQKDNRKVRTDKANRSKVLGNDGTSTEEATSNDGSTYGNGNGNGNGNGKENTIAPPGACPPKPLNPLLALGWLGGWKWVKNASDEMCKKIWELHDRDFERSDDPNSPYWVWARVSWFEEFWMSYWLLKGKKRAREIYFALVPTLDIHEKIMAAIDAQSPEMLARSEDKRPYATTWLNGARWDDKAASRPDEGFSLESIQ